MSKLRAVFATICLLSTGAFIAEVIRATAHAAPKGDGPSKATNGATDVAATATAMWTTGTGGTVLSGRNAFAIYNNGTQIIYCGWSSAVTTATGFPVGVNSSLSIDVVYNGTGDKMLYCINASGSQSSPANTRWIQVK